MIGAVFELTVPSLDVSVHFGFDCAADAELVRACVDGRMSGARLPAVHWTAQAGAGARADVTLAVTDVGADLLVRFAGAVETPEYRVDKAGFHWDFWKMFTALALPGVIDGGVVALHAAVVGVEGMVTLLPGVSGAGKSSVAFAARSHGANVYASELAFLRDAQLIAANSRMTIDPAALTRFGIGVPAQAELRAGRVSLAISPRHHTLRVTRVVFPKVTAGPLVVRPISDRRARMLLFENALSQLPMAHLLAHETVPVAISPPATQLHAIAREVAAISSCGAVIAEGTPDTVAAYALESD